MHGHNRVLRGGSWNNNAQNVRSAYRNHNEPGNRNNNIGFRCAQAQDRAGWLGFEQTRVQSAVRRRKEIGVRCVSSGPAEAARTLTGTLFIPRFSNFMTDAIMDSTTRIRHPLVDGCPPEWASGWGQDEFGIFAEFSLPEGGGRWVTQRMRWIPAGRFLMGSPEDEPGRDSDEGPQRGVMISKALWIFDTPCTQALWRAVMGDNPSRFVDPDRPVEQVSWDDTNAFIAKLNSAVGGLALRLPTEAEWEYACRAGTTEATYAGPMEILGNRNAPVLDEIAWYGGNSGVDFDLEDGWDSSNWPEKQYDHQKAGTRKVGEKLPNRWGLFDMLGNVWEWCSDWYDAGAYRASASVDPTGPTDGHYRVLRGGGWSDSAQGVRSAYRYHYEPGGRDGNFGFRCAQVQGA